MLVEASWASCIQAKRQSGYETKRSRGLGVFDVRGCYIKIVMAFIMNKIDAVVAESSRLCLRRCARDAVGSRISGWGPTRWHWKPTGCEGTRLDRLERLSVLRRFVLGSGDFHRLHLFGSCANLLPGLPHAAGRQGAD